MDPQPIDSARDGFWMRIIVILSVVVSGAVAFLILGPRPDGMEGAMDVSALPGVNAGLNGLTTVILLVGFWFIKQRNFEAHKKAMLSAFGTSSAFMVTYIIYHWFKAGPAKYNGEFREIYLVILLTHIVLAALIIPLALVTLYRGWSGNLAKHKRIARITLPLWLYVSVTGVVIYLMVHN
jgi:putative membrane protein